MGSALALLSEIETEDLEAAPALHRQFQRAIHQARIEQMTVQLQLTALHGAGRLRAHRFRLSQAQGQAFGAAARLHELAQGRFHRLESGVGHALPQFGADLIDKNPAAKVDRVAGKTNGVGLADGEPFFSGNTLFDAAVGPGVKGLGIIKKGAVFQGTETGVKMIKSRVGQAQGNDFDVEPLRQLRMGGQLAAKAVSGPQTSARRVEQGVARAFERKVRRQFKNLEALFLEPFFEYRFFALAFARQKAAQDKLLPQHQTRVGGEHHVRQSGQRRDALHFRVFFEQTAQRSPLAGSGLAGGFVDVPLHPGIDDVIHFVVVGRAHQEARFRNHALIYAKGPGLAIGGAGNKQEGTEGTTRTERTRTFGLHFTSSPMERIKAKALLFSTTPGRNR